MERKYPNLYQRARLSTGLTQERAAELLGLSPESLKQYEGGKTVPKDETVAKMVEAYSCPWLALEHAQATDTLGVIAGGDAKAAANGEHRPAEPSARRNGPAGCPAPDRGGRRDRRG